MSVLVQKEAPDFAAQAGIDLPEPYGIALRWTALEPIYTFRAIWKFDRAQNWEEFRAAAQDLGAPSQNLVYADVDGNIGYQTPGNIPIRRNGDGTLPVPGWTDEYEWQGYIPFEELPNAPGEPAGLRLPTSLAEALDALRADEVLCEGFGRRDRLVPARLTLGAGAPRRGRGQVGVGPARVFQPLLTARCPAST